MAEGEFALVRQHLEAALKLPGLWVGAHELYALLADAATPAARRGRIAGSMRPWLKSWPRAIATPCIKPSLIAPGAWRHCLAGELCGE